MKFAFLISCEHAFNTIPEEFKNVFIPETIIHSHYGYDEGAYDLAKFLYESLNYNQKLLIHSTITRLLIDYNRSLDNPKIFSKFSKYLSKNQKELLIKNYKIFRERSYRFISDCIQKNFLVIHFSIHSFVSVFKSKYRKTEIGILYDPRNFLEKKFAKELKKKLSPYICHLNLPYRGYTDGHTTQLRQMFKEKYIGIEFEINQNFVKKNQVGKSIKLNVVNAIHQTCKKLCEDQL